MRDVGVSDKVVDPKINPEIVGCFFGIQILEQDAPEESHTKPFG